MEEKLNDESTAIDFLYEAFDERKIDPMILTEENDSPYLVCEPPRHFKGTPQEFEKLKKEYLDLSSSEKCEFFILLHEGFCDAEEALGDATALDRYEGVYEEDEDYWRAQIMDYGGPFCVEWKEPRKGWDDWLDFLDYEKMTSYFRYIRTSVYSEVLDANIYYYSN